MHIHMFEPRLVALIDEIANHHPHITAMCCAQPDTDFYVQLSEVAAAVGIILDGTYSQADVYELCEKITKTLVASRTSVIMPFNDAVISHTNT